MIIQLGLYYSVFHFVLQIHNQMNHLTVIVYSRLIPTTSLYISHHQTLTIREDLVYATNTLSHSPASSAAPLSSSASRSQHLMILKL